MPLTAKGVGEVGGEVEQGARGGVVGLLVTHVQGLGPQGSGVCRTGEGGPGRDGFISIC